MSFWTDRASREKRYAEAIGKAEQIIGGYKVSILNYTGRTEKKFTITGTNGYYFATSDKEEFLNIIRGIIWRIRN